jgi:hypothetical protein
MSKTPLQTAIEQIQTKIAECTEFDNERGAYMTCKAILTALLPTEREVIEEAWNTGKEDGKDMGYHGRAEHTSAQHYFTTKFNDNEHTKS